MYATKRQQRKRIRALILKLLFSFAMPASVAYFYIQTLPPAPTPVKQVQPVSKPIPRTTVQIFVDGKLYETWKGYADEPFSKWGCSKKGIYAVKAYVTPSSKLKTLTIDRAAWRQAVNKPDAKIIIKIDYK